jgi:hypothetical protein
MMGLIMTFVMILVFIFFIACTVGITLGIKNKNILNKPSWDILISLVFQLLLFTLFFTEVLASFPKVIVHLLWWGAVLSGLVFKCFFGWSDVSYVSHNFHVTIILLS